MVKETLLENFFVKPRAVEAHRHGTLDIGEQCFVARRGINAVGIKSLIENEFLKHRNFVDEEFISVEPHAPQSEITLYAIFAIAQPKIVKSAFADFPKMFFL